MIAACMNYFSELTAETGRCWTRFWFTPRETRILGLLRFGVGAVALYWYLSFLPVFELLFGGDGLISPELTQAWRGGRTAISVFDWAGNDGALWFLYALGGLATFSMMIGWRANVTTLLAAVFAISLLHRGPIFARPGDDLLAMLMIYLALAPTGRSWSLDAFLAGRKEGTKADCCARFRGEDRPSIMANLAIRLIQVHFALYLLAMLVWQLTNESWWTGTALWGWVARVDSRWYDASWLRERRMLLAAWTVSLLLWEAGSALLWWPKLRPLLTVWGVILWGSLAVTGGAVLLPATMILASFAFWQQDA